MLLLFYLSQTMHTFIRRLIQPHEFNRSKQVILYSVLEAAALVASRVMKQAEFSYIKHEVW
jgi:hypothetical protein